MKLPTLQLTAQAPWPGPAAYDERDSAFFFGRTAEAAELLRLVRAEPVSVLFGLSGLGKTSLLQAGLFPRLRDEGLLPVRIRLDHDAKALPPVQQVLSAVARSARDQGVIAPDWDAESDTLVQAFCERDERFWGADEFQPVTPVLVLDQFEECWTATRSNAATRARAEAFITQLATVIRTDAARDATLRVVFAIREDQLAPLESLRPLFPGLRTARLRLQAFTRAQALSVVTKPGAALLEAGAADSIVDTFAASDPEHPIADPALLSIFCWRLNEDRRAQEATRIAAERVVELRGEFIRRFYDGALVGLEPDQAAAARKFVESDLIDAIGYRTSAGFQHAERQHDVRPATLEHLINQRLLHPVDRSVGQRHVELVHDRIAEEAASQRSGRHQRERQEQGAREQEALRQKLTRARRRTLAFAVIALVACSAFAIALRMRQRAIKAQSDATSAFRAMRSARDEAERLTNVAELAQQRSEASKEALDHQKEATERALDKALAARSEADKVIRFLQDDLSNLGGLEIALRKRINERVTAYRELFPPDADDAEAANDDTIAALQRAGILLEQGDSAGARTTLEQAIVHAGDVLSAHPSNQRSRRILTNATIFREMIADPVGAVRTLAVEFDRAIHMQGANPERQHAAATASGWLQSVSEALQGDKTMLREIILLHQQRLALWQSISDYQPKDPSVLKELANSHFALSVVLNKAGDKDESLRSAEAALRLQESLVQQTPDDLNLMSSLKVIRERVTILRNSTLNH